VIVRQFQATDAPSLSHTCYLDRPIEQVQAHLRWLLSEQVKGRLVCLVAQVDERAVASGHLALLRAKGEIGSIYVAPNHRRQGIGTALVQALIEQAQLRPVETLVITANVNAPWIRAWYERLGFTFDRFHDFPGERVAILTMDLAQGDRQ
jgi:ribosomal protein S18 acetylase RimI-like enzyme